MEFPVQKRTRKAIYIRGAIRIEFQRDCLRLRGCEDAPNTPGADSPRSLRLMDIQDTASRACYS